MAVTAPAVVDTRVVGATLVDTTVVDTTVVDTTVVDTTVVDATAPSVPVPATASGHLLLRPGCLAAMAVLVVNDHWLKDRLGPDPRWGPVTGKASDVAGLVFFPLLLVSLVELLRLGRRQRLRLLTGAVLVTGTGFAAIKVVPAAAATYCWGPAALRWVPAGLVAMGTAGPPPPLPTIAHVMDASDCLCLPALWLSLRIGRR